VFNNNTIDLTSSVNISNIIIVAIIMVVIIVVTSSIDAELFMPSVTNLIGLHLILDHIAVSHFITI
jgi:hypothetical protein